MALVERKTSDARTLQFVRRFNASRERVFRAFAEPGELIKWWGPSGMDVVDHAIDVRVGGAWWTTIRSENGEDQTISGVYLEITPPERLVFTWAWERDDRRGHETVVTIELREQNGRTELSFNQQIFESEEAHDQHHQGWSSSFDCLDLVLPDCDVRSTSPR